MRNARPVPKIVGSVPCVPLKPLIFLADTRARIVKISDAPIWLTPIRSLRTKWSQMKNEAALLLCALVLVRTGRDRDRPVLIHVSFGAPEPSHRTGRIC
jgi:hypothetical protein